MLTASIASPPSMASARESSAICPGGRRPGRALQTPINGPISSCAVGHLSGASRGMAQSTTNEACDAPCAGAPHAPAAQPQECGAAAASDSNSETDEQAQGEKQYQCEFDCGFTGSFSDVEAHESVCPVRYEAQVEGDEAVDEETDEEEEGREAAAAMDAVARPSHSLGGMAGAEEVGIARAQPQNLAHYPCLLATLNGRGHGLVAARDLEAGELVLRSERMGYSVRVKHEQYWCVECLRHRLPGWSPPLPVACQVCSGLRERERTEWQGGGERGRGQGLKSGRGRERKGARERASKSPRDTHTHTHTQSI